MSNKYVWVFFLLVVLSSSKPLKQTKIVKAINCGMKEGSIKSEDIKYDSVLIADNAGLQLCSRQIRRCGLSLRHQCSRSWDKVIPYLCPRYAMDKEIYMFERHTYQEMTYSLPVRSGTHTIILKFAEVTIFPSLDVFPKRWPEGF